MKTFAAYTFAIIWLAHFALGCGAGYAAVRLWYFRHHPLIGKVGLCLLGFSLDVITAMTLLFVARGVRFTWTYGAVLTIGTLISDIPRIPLVVYIIRGSDPDDPAGRAPTSGELPPEHWTAQFQQIRRMLRRQHYRSKKTR